jgi:hypothetical protein
MMRAWHARRRPRTRSTRWPSPGGGTFTNLPSRSAPVLARTVTSLGALSGGRIVLGIGAGGSWDAITTLG